MKPLPFTWGAAGGPLSAVVGRSSVLLGLHVMGMAACIRQQQWAAKIHVFALNSVLLGFDWSLWLLWSRTGVLLPLLLGAMHLQHCSPDTPLPRCRSQLC